MKNQRIILMGSCIPKKDRKKWDLLVRGLKINPEKGDFLIGIDGGTQEWVRRGFVPQWAVGDWDSLTVQDKKKFLKKIPHETLSADKDRSDLHFALQKCRKMNVSEVICLGLSDGRPDHHLAVLLEVREFALKSSQQFSILSLQADYHFISPGISPWRQKWKKGQCVSVFSLFHDAEGVSLQGFRYSLKRFTLTPSSHGLSNLVEKAQVEISLDRGCLVVIVPKGN